MIGIFDSGLGGLTVLKAILNHRASNPTKLPAYDYLYLGDNARAPYGNKSPEMIYEYTRQAVDFLHAQGCTLIIIACNTASGTSLRAIQQSYLPRACPNVGVLGVIKPLVEKIAQTAGMQRVGVIGTTATVRSDVYATELHKLNAGLEVIQSAAPLLVPLIEEGWLKRPETKMILKKYLRPLKQKNIQALMLACTHYQFLLADIRRIMTKRCLVFDPGAIVAERLADYLSRHPELHLKPSPRPQRLFYTTDDPAKFKLLGEKFLGQTMGDVYKIELQT